MVTISNVQPTNEGAKIDYSVTFEGTNHSLYGDFFATKDETSQAFQNSSGADFDGFRKLVLERLNNEARNALQQYNK